MEKAHKNRIIVEDIAKGIAITLVVMFHTIELPQMPGLIIIGCFAYVLVFFYFVCGYNYQDKGLSYVQNIKKRTLQILVPFFICTTLIMLIMGAYFLIRNDATIQELIYSALVFWMSKWGCHMIGWYPDVVLYQRILGPCWFVLFLIPATLVFYAFVGIALKNIKTLVPTIILLCGISIVLIQFNIELPWGIQNAPAIAGLMILGAYLQKYNFISDEIKLGVKRVIISIAALVIFIVIQLLFQQAGLLTAGELGNVLGGLEIPIMFLNAICGTYFLITLSLLIKKSKILSRFFVWCGKNSLFILIFHLSFVHIINDILGVPQWNASQELFCETFNPLMIATFIIAFTLLCCFILGVNKTIKLIRR